MSAFVPNPKYLGNLITGTVSKAPNARTKNFEVLYRDSNIGMINSVVDPNRIFNDSPSLLLVSEFDTRISPVENIKSFEAIAPDTTILVGFGVVVFLSVVASFVWANEVVPVSRTKLALSKRDGEVKEYLDGLKDPYLDTLESDADNDEIVRKNVEIKPNVGDGRDVERWLFSDWLNNNKSGGGGRKKSPALPILKKAKWNSG
eukprot:CAMPEP_0113300278 /NCGR_PEP_ID=MMETSP0010_2-20120614/1975_1 /TAXON_ID=216773 ORGANISM="Corethron hystrix, Strain 308" /NCGR_SAMPLE_ID=MMETSP0010_2 /ASSEMBLY_ACC=CAM_ASM_000155 /LENGTH=202 /DNA_ID=CAMNT_0000153677 /DNA_START=403 /DNA_END=1007 /DNA_ORIENTATION=- /assembly_acc=CAM_ASM_000155